MSENLHDIDDLFRRALNEHEDEPSGKVWENLDKQLDKNKIVHIKRKYYALKWVAAALLIFSFAAGMYALQVKLRNKELVKESKTRTIEKTFRGNSTENLSAPSTTPNNIETKKDARPSTFEKQTKETALNKNNADLAKNNKHDEASQAANTNVSIAKNQTNKVLKSNLNKQNITKAEINTISNKRSYGNEAIAKNKVDDNVLRKENNSSKVFNQKVDNAILLKDALAFKQVDGIETIKPEKNITILQSLNETLSPVHHSLQPVVLNKNENTITPSANVAKKTNTKKLTTSPISITAFLSPDAVLDDLRDDKPNFREDDKNMIKQKERNGFSYTTGLLINYNLTKNWSIQSGVTLLKKVTRIESKTLYARPDEHGDINYRFNCSAGYSYLSVKAGSNPLAGDSITALPSKNTLKYISVPVAVKYNITAGNFIFSPAGGLSANFLTEGKIQTGITKGANSQDEVLNNINGLKSSYISGLLSFEAGYKFTPKLSFSLTPIARFGLTSINKDAPVQSYLNSFGLAGGLTFRF